MDRKRRLAERLAYWSDATLWSRRKLRWAIFSRVLLIVGFLTNALLASRMEYSVFFLILTILLSYNTSQILGVYRSEKGLPD